MGGWRSSVADEVFGAFWMTAKLLLLLGQGIGENAHLAITRSSGSSHDEGKTDTVLVVTLFPRQGPLCKNTGSFYE